MDNPEQEIESVIQLLVSSPPSTQRKSIETYFLPNASFTHPFCRTGSFDGSRVLIRGIYRWYKILSPHIDLTVHAVAYDKPNETLYVDISQVFQIWFVPFYRAPVRLVTVLGLHRDTGNGKYYLKSQNDLYQTDEFVKFVLPGVGSLLVWAWQFLVSLVCLLLAFVFWPVSWLEEFGAETKGRAQGQISGVVSGLLNGQGDTAARGRKTGRSEGVGETGAFDKHGSSGLVTAPSIEQR